MSPPTPAPLTKYSYQDDPKENIGRIGVQAEIDMDDRYSQLPKFGDPEVKKFSYDKLSNMHKRIRLLTLNSGAKETNEVECRLFEGEISQGQVLRVENGVVLDEVVSYEALSWSWGTREPRYQVLIRKGDERHEKEASPSLVWALRYLRYPNRDRVLWIDALCIDQKNVEEKNHQVQMMSQIYSYADSVCIWLGLDDRNTRMAIKFIQREILKLEQFDALCQDPANSQKWQSLLLLMQKPWFFRRWVVQEIALAKRATIYCGPDQIDWKDFSVAVELFVEVETATHRLSEVMKKDPDFYHVPGWFEYVSALGASLLVEATGMIFRYYKSKAPPKVLPKTVATANGGTPKTQHDGSTEESDSDLHHSFNYDDIPSESEDEGPVGKAGGSGAVASDGTPAAPPPGAPDAGNSQKSTSERKPDPPEDPISQRRPLLSLEYLVSRLSIFEATEPRDAIYALLAIANDGYPAAEGSGDDALNSLHAFLGSPAGQQRQKAFPVDYGRSYADVCQNFIEFCIKKPNNDFSVRGGSWTRERTDRTRAMDIICRPWAPEPKPGLSIRFNSPKKSMDVGDYWKDHYKNLKKIQRDAWDAYEKKAKEEKKEPRTKKEFFDPLWKKLPTFIPRLAGAPFAMHNQAGVHIMKMGRKNADPLVGFPNSQRNYDAAQGVDVDMDTLSFRKSRRFGTHSMFIKGFILEKIKSTAHPSQSGNIPQEWLNMAGWQIKDFGDPAKDKGPPDEFWRTLVADRGRDSRNPPYYYKKACKESIYKGGLQSGSVNTSDLINNERNSIVAQFCRRVQAVIWNRSMVKTDQGNLGITAKGVRQGDLVCILYGCSVPVILRERLKSQEERDEDSGDEEMMQDVEKIMRRGMATMKGNRRRKTAYEGIPARRDRDWKPRPNKGGQKETPNKEGQKETNWVGPDGRPRWSKEQVAKWLEDYNKKLKSNGLGPNDKGSRKPQGADCCHRKGQSGARRMDKNDDSPRPPRAPRDVYYEFLGECYIHGMMDGEAMARKAGSEEAEAEKWNQFALICKERREQAPAGGPEDTNKKASKVVVPDELKKEAKEVQDHITKRAKYHQDRKEMYKVKVGEWVEREKSLQKWEEECEKKRLTRADWATARSPRSRPTLRRWNTMASASTTGAPSRTLSRQTTLPTNGVGLGIQTTPEEIDEDEDEAGWVPVGEGGTAKSE
ncbi:hypothetical protein MAPG_09789, partial [Magnaporthiopsis poae ATCC 64411]